MYWVKKIFSFSLVFPLIFFIHCTTVKNANKNKSTQQENTASCVEFIMQQDDSLGAVRNHACKKISLSRAISQYVNAIEQLDFSRCPEEFSLAFQKHINAWKEMIKLTDQFPHLRGEMHTLFTTIAETKAKEKFAPLLKAIWDTWAEVENAQQD
ncbi:MAG: hypothetical protein KDC06_09700 [Chitinophagaceae bacterium]|nr:hypothetical protein [Chitinophagaceae bacterium]